jgi:ABC-type transport system involved in multi-copper enzyme maturation permease subunit
MCIGWFGQGAFVNWNRYIFQVEQMTVMFTGTAMYILISAYIYTREFSCGTVNTLFSYPVSRAKIFAAKFIIIVLIMFCAMALQLTLTILGGLLLPHEKFTTEIFIAHLRLQLYVLILQCAILPVSTFIALVSRNIIMPIVYGGLVTTINVSVTGLKIKSINDYLPSMYPISILFNSFKEVGKGEMLMVNSKLTLSNSSIFIAAITFIISITFCVIYYLKTDIN